MWQPIRKWNLFLLHAWSVRIQLFTFLMVCVVETANTYWFIAADKLPLIPFIAIGLGLTVLAQVVQQPKLVEKMQNDTKPTDDH